MDFYIIAAAFIFAIACPLFFAWQAYEYEVNMLKIRINNLEGQIENSKKRKRRTK